MDLPGSIAAVGSALAIVKELREIDAQMDRTELKLKIAELTSALAEAKLGLIDVAEQLHGKDAQIAELQKLLRYRAENLADENGFRYEAVDGQPKGKPFCPVCEAKGVYVKLAQDLVTPGRPYLCPSCKANYGYNGVFKS